MEINVSASGIALGEDDTRPERVRVTIEIDSEHDDPAGHLWGLLMGERLANVLRLYGQGQALEIDGPGDVWELLSAAGRMRHRLDTTVNGLMWAARDTYGSSWGEIASAMDMPRKSVRNIVERVRAAYAANGAWRDSTGYHEGATPEHAHERSMQRVRELALREPGDRIQ